MFFLHLIAALDIVNGDFFEELFEEHKDRVYRLATRYLGNEEDAQEIVQETFIEVYMHIKLFRELTREDAIALIVIYTRNNVIDYVRKRKRRLQTIPMTYEEDGEEKLYDVPSMELSPEETLMQEELCQRLGGCIDALPDGQREVILLKYRYDMKDRDIARALRIKESAVSSRLNRAKEKLRGMLEEASE